jgi:hypothetical protein
MSRHLLTTTDRDNLRAKCNEASHLIYKAIFVLTCLRGVDVDPVEVGTISELTNAIDALRFTANHTLHDIH